jgi:hypothetical protein
LQRQVVSYEELLMYDSYSDVSVPDWDHITNALEQVDSQPLANPNQLAAYYLGIPGGKKLSKGNQRKLQAKAHKIKTHVSKTIKATEQKVAKQVRGAFNKKK